MISISFVLAVLLCNIQSLLAEKSNATSTLMYIPLPKKLEQGSIIHIKGFTLQSANFKIALSKGPISSWIQDKEPTFLFLENAKTNEVCCFKDLKPALEETPWEKQNSTREAYGADVEVDIMIRFGKNRLTVFFNNKELLSNCGAPPGELCEATHLNIEGINTQQNNTKWIYFAGENYPPNNTFYLEKDLFKLGDKLEVLVNLRDSPCNRAWAIQIFDIDKDTPLMLHFKANGEINIIRYIASSNTWAQFDTLSNYVQDRDRCGIAQLRIQYLEEPASSNTNKPLRYFKVRVFGGEYEFLVPDQRSNFSDIVGGQILQFGEPDDVVEILEVQYLKAIQIG